MRCPQMLALVLAMCLISAPFLGRCAEEDEVVDGEYGEEEDGYDEMMDINEEKVAILTKDNFTATLESATFALVEFYAPWCGHCKALAPEYAQAALSLAEISSDVVLGKVDATIETELAEKFGVEGYPTLKWFVNGTESEYSGGRDEEEIVRWVRKKIGPVAATIDTAEALKSTEESADTVVVGYFKEFAIEGDATYSSFQEAASNIDDVEFVQTTNAEVAKAAGLTTAGSIGVVTNFKGEARATVAYTGAIEHEALQSFVDSEKMPLTIEFNSENAEKIFSSNIPRHLLLVANSDDLKDGAATLKTFREVSATMKSKQAFVFVTVAADNDDGEPVVQFFGLENSPKPAVVAFEVEPDQKKFKFPGTYSTASLIGFANGVIDGSIEPDYKSQDIPQGDDAKDGNVQIVVSKSFDTIVKSPEKDVLLEVYAPWCGHCKSLEPIYAKLATRFKDIDSVVIAKLDGTENEHKDLSVEGFPTILFYPASAGAEAISYEGERTLAGMTKFLKENAVISYELKKKGESDDDDEEVESTEALEGSQGEAKDEL